MSDPLLTFDPSLYGDIPYAVPNGQVVLPGASSAPDLSGTSFGEVAKGWVLNSLSGRNPLVNSWLGVVPAQDGTLVKWPNSGLSVAGQPATAPGGVSGVLVLGIALIVGFLILKAV